MIEGKVSGAEAVIGKLSKFGRSIEDTVSRVVTRFALQVSARTKEKLSDDVLHVRTGRLRRSIHEEVTRAPGQVTGTVGTNVEYARRHEMGFSGTEAVRASVRMQVMAWGKSMKNPRMVQVKGFERKVNVPEKSFLRSSLNELGPKLQEELSDEVGQTVKTIGL